ncbi:MAG: hypothetical protein II889_05410 [Clostridia bacterium]|nr:hypothetical protein [Clostridia bacterium]
MKRTRILSALLALLLLLPATLAGCRKKAENDTGLTEDGEPIVLDHVYRGTAFPLPEKWTLNSSVPPLWKDGVLTCLASMTEEHEDPDGNIQYIQRTAVFTLTEDGEPVRRDLDLGENNYVESGILSETSLLYLRSDMDFESGTAKIYLNRYDFATGETTVSDDLGPQFDIGETGMLFVNFLAADGDGDLYLASDQQVLILSPDFIRKGTVTAPQFINSLAASSDGHVYVTGRFNGKSSFAAIDKETSSFGAAKPLPQNANNIFFADGYDLYVMGETAVMGLTVGEDGETATETVCDFMNSDLSRGRAELLAVIDADTLLFAERLDEADYLRTPMLYRHVPDVDLSSLTSIRIAYLGYTTEAIGQIVAFNRAHTDCRAVLDDYTVYQTEENYNGGYERLALDITTGVYRPDIVLGPYGCEPINLLWEKGWYADLLPFMEKDDLVNPDNLFGAVKHVFDDGKGGMTGIWNSFEIDALVSTRDLLGEYAERGYWTTDELLDYAEGLPEDVTLAADLYQESAPSILCGQKGFGAFIDFEHASCTFDSPEFLRLLRYIGTLPTIEEYRKTSPYANLGRNERYLPYFEGKIALRLAHVWMIDYLPGLETQFNTKDYVLIGYPTTEKRAGAGNVVRTNGAAVLTSFCRAPETAWEVIRSLITGRTSHGSGLPALKSDYDAEIEQYLNGTVHYQYFDGGGGSRPDDPEHPMTVDDLDRPGIVFRYTKEMAEEYKKILDEVGAPLSAGISDELYGIITEEISAYCGGSCTAEDCAKRIQSRVGIWLAEHK